MREADLLQHVLSIAAKHDVLAFHCYDSRQTSAPGFPDLVLSSHTRTIFVELKIDDTSQGYLKPEQREWRDRLTNGSEEWYLWRPRHLQSGEIEETIRSLNE